MKLLVRQLLTLFVALSLLALPGVAPAAAAPGTDAPRTVAVSAPESPGNRHTTGAEPAGGQVLDVRHGLADAPAPGLSPEVAAAAERDGEVAVIVRLREQADLPGVEADARRAERAAAVQVRAAPPRGRDPASVSADARQAGHAARVGAVVGALRETSERARGPVQALLDGAEAAGRARDVRPFWVFSGFAATVDAATLAELAGHPDVASVTLDETLELPGPEDGDGPRLPSWSLERVRAPQVWGEYGISGEGVVVGVLDSGVDGGHPALAGSYRGRDGDHGASWLAATGENYPAPGDGHGHGTHVTGSIVGDAPGEVIGVAPGAEWIAAKIFRDTGTTTASIIHAAAEWILAPGGDPANAPHVVNNSWGSIDSLNTEYWDDVAAWVAAGIVPVFANGNSGPGPGSVGSPASFPHAIGVGATDSDDVIAPFSSRGPVTWDGVQYTKPQVSAPGVHVRSAWPRQLGMDYRELSGTSMAAPHVAGVAALVLSANPDLPVEEVREVLEGTARAEDHMGSLPDDTYGHGVVDAFEAATRARFSGVVEGTVTDPGGAPVEAAVTVPGTPARTTSDPETGAFELPVVEGSWTVEAEAFGYHPAGVDVTVVAGQRHEVALTLESAAVRTLSGLVVDAAGQPVPSARVQLRDTPLDARYTGEDGRFALEAPEGSYVLAASAHGYRGTSQDVTVDGDTDVTVTLRALDQAAEPGWRQFQNDTANSGFSGEALAAGTLTEAWTASLGGRPIFNAAVIAGERVLVTTEDGRLHALDAADGRSRWTFTAGANLRSTPLVAGGTVYLGGGDSHTLYALDAATGAPRWQFDTGDERLTYTTPTIAHGNLYFATGWGSGNGGTVYALDPGTGAEQWSYHVGGQVFFGPATSGDGLVFAGSADERRMVALDATSGDLVWEAGRDEDTFVGAPSYHGGELYAVTTDFDSGRGALVAYDAATGGLRWERDQGDGQGSAPVVYDDLVIAGGHTRGTVTAYDRASGDVVWRYAAGGAVSVSQLATADGYVVGGAQLDRRVWALDAASGELVWEDARADSVLTAPALADGLLVTADASGAVTAYRPSGQVAGTVTGPDGPVEAAVRVGEVETTTDAATGAFEVTHPPGEVTVEVTRYGLGRAEREVTVLAGRTVTADFALEAVGDGSLEGTVTAAGAPLAGALVRLDGTPLDPETTGDDGTFAFPEVAAGRYRLDVEAAGYVPASVEVEIAEGEAATAAVDLERYDVGVLGDHQGAIAAFLEAEGLRVEHTDYADVASRPEDFPVVVANGAQDRPDDDAVVEAFLDATDAAGTSVVWLDQWSVGYGAIRALSQVTGDPEQVVTGSRDGRVSLAARTEHPLTAALDAGARVEFLTPGSDHASFRGYSGRVLADLHTDGTGTAGGAIAYQPRGLSGAHVLLSAHAATPWAGPQRNWQPVARQVFLDALAYARDAAYGELAGLVDDGDGNPRGDATATVVETGERATTGADGAFALLLEPGDYTLRVDRIGSQPVTVEVQVTAGETTSVEVSLPDSGLGAVQGTVTSARGGAVEGAEAVLSGFEDRPAVTGPDGGYEIPDVPGGTYTLTVTADGHLPADVSGVEVAAGSATTVDVELATAARVAVLGDRMGQIVGLLTDAGMTASEIGWGDVDAALGDLDVVVVNNPPDPGRDAFLAFLDALDAAEVSAVFFDERFTSQGSVRYLRSHVGDPSSHLPVTADGDMHLVARDADHPLFDGFDDGRAHVLAPLGTSALLDTYSGIPLADLETETVGLRGVGAAYQPRTPGSVHLLLGGLAATVFQHPDQRWTDETPQFYVNAVNWAAAPGLGELAGRVTDPDGAPIAAAEVAVDGAGLAATTDAEGRYRLAVPPGEHEVRVAAFGYLAVTETVAVGRNQQVTLDAVLEVGDVGSVTGTVTSTGEIRPGAEAGQPLAGARVRLLGTPREAVTGEDGTFALARVEPGEFELEVLADGHVRTITAVEVAAGEATTADVLLRPSPTVGVLDDHQGHAAGYLSHWGYEPVAIGWDDLGALAEIDLVVANLASFPNLDPGADGWRAFEDAVNRAGAPVLWLDQFGRGAIQWLRDYEGDPAVREQGRNTGTVTAEAVDAAHPLLAGLPSSFELTEPNREHAWFDGYSGEVVARLVTGTAGDVGATVAYRGRTTANVDVLLSTLSISTYGWPAYGDEPGHRYTPEAERLLRNALEWALDAPPLAGEARGTVRAPDGTPLAGDVTVAETGVTYAVRDGDGTFVVPLQPGQWTLEVSSFGYHPAIVEVALAAGEVARPQVTLEPVAAGTVAGRVSDDAGVPVAGASIDLLGTPLGTTTGDDGRYEIAPVPAGDYELEVRRDGFRVVRLPVTVEAGETATVDVTLPASELIALAGDHTGGQLQALLESEGYEVAAHPYSTAGLDALTASVGDYAMVILNGRGSTPSAAAFTGAVEAADEAGLPVIFAGQWGSVSAINHARNYLGDPENAFWGFVPEAITYTPEVEHPIFAGFEPGEPVQILHNPGLNQQYLAFEGYSGTTLAAVGDAAGERIGDGVGYRFTSPTSVHVLLASLGASIYGSPGNRWTDDAVTIYLNAVAWALEATQGEVSGTVTSGGEPVAGATVTAVEAGAQARTGDDGSYRLGVPDGEHTIRVEAFGFEPFEAVIEVEESGAVTLDVELVPLPTGDLAGTVTGAGGEPLAGADVTVSGPVEAEAATGDDGAFAVAGLFEGDYEVTAAAEGHLPATVEVTVVAGETVEVALALQPLDVAVLGDAGGVLVEFLRGEDVPAAEIAWADAGDLDGYSVVVVNGGEADAEAFAALLEAADEASASLVFTGTWGVASGGVRLLERFTDDVAVGGHGYGDGPVALTGFDLEHPLFEGLEDPVVIGADGAYYSWLDGYVGHLLADLATGEDGVLGAGVALDWRGAEHAHLLLSASAVTARIGPGYGWTADGERLVVNAVEWLREASQPLPDAPTLEADAELVAAESVTVRGTGEFRATVTVLRDGEPVAEASPERDGAWSAEVPLVEGPNELVAVVSNFAGDSEPSPAVTVVRDTLGPELDWTPADGQAVLEPVVEVAGTATDPSGVALVEVGGEEVAVGGDGAWSVEVPLVEGANTLVLRAVDTLGNETVEQREVAYLPYEVTWQVPSQGSARAVTPVRLTVRDEAGEPVVLDAATLVVHDADGVEVARETMLPQGPGYEHRLRGLPPGTYALSADLEVGGWWLPVDGPGLHLR